MAGSARKNLPVGAIWSVPAGEGERVEVLTPAGMPLVVVAGPDGAPVALAEPGEYVAGEHTVTAKD